MNSIQKGRDLAVRLYGGKTRTVESILAMSDDELVQFLYACGFVFDTEWFHPPSQEAQADEDTEAYIDDDDAVEYDDDDDE
jgi:hypothetical protein